MTKTNLPARGKTGGMLDRIRASKAVVAPAKSGGLAQTELLAAALAGAGRPRLVFAFDATASREAGWTAAQRVTDELFTTLPGELDIALAVHGGSRLHTFTGFSSDPQPFRRAASSVHCEGGMTRLVEIMDKTRDSSGVKVMVYIGDAFEETEGEAIEAAKALALKGTRCLMFLEGDDPTAAEVFGKIANITGGALLPFASEAADDLRDTLQAVAVLAVGGVKLLEAKAKAQPAARLLLSHLRR